MAGVDDLWRRVSTEPLISPRPGTLFGSAATTPDVILDNHMVHLYVGAVADGTEQLVHLEVPAEQITSGKPITGLTTAQTVLRPGPAAFDAFHVFDPAVLQVGNLTFLYYSGIGAREDQLGGAVSFDGLHFDKHSEALLLGRAPESVLYDGQVYLLYILPEPAHGYAIHLAVSSDGLQFTPASSRPVLTVGGEAEWDCYEVTTPRIFARGDHYYMLYAGGGDPNRPDLPQAFGLARSRDLRNWVKYPRNPVFRCGGPGQWDDGAIWFPTVFAWQESLYLVYEGGAESDVGGSGPAPTQVGLAQVASRVFDSAMMEW